MELETATGCQGEPFSVQPTAFIRDLVKTNGLDKAGFSRFVFFPGMLFDTRLSWWGDGGFRPASHEGIDLCLMENGAGRIFRLDSSIRVPAAFAGQIVRIMDDFLGQTVVVAHSKASGTAGSLLTLYAHVRPDNGFQVGDRLEAGQPFAAIAPVRSEKAPLPPHLHLSFSEANRLPSLERLEWPLLNRVDRNAFCDPLPVLGCDYRLMDYTSDLKDFAAFPPVGSYF